MVAKTNLNKKKRFALISTFRKEKLEIVCEIFKKNEIMIISTGSTAKVIKKLGYECLNVSDLTGYDEILDGRVKTLHPKIYASLLYQRNNKKHKATFEKLEFPTIDFVVVNLYPFESAIKQNSSHKEIIDMIDIGGPALLRAGGKNYQSITTICNPSNYELFYNEMLTNKGRTSLSFRKEMSYEVFIHTSRYDTSIANWFSPPNDIAKDITSFEKNKLRYGENPNQKADVFFDKGKPSIFTEKIHGKEISYNNCLDIEAALNCLSEFNEPTCVIIKHNNPCGAASNKNINLALTRALNSDPVSAFGGIVAINRIFDVKLAKKISKKFIEIIIAKGFKKEALNILKNKKNIILINSNNLYISKKKEIKSINNGYLVQEKNDIKIKLLHLKLKSNYKLKINGIEDLVFALKVCKHVKSNAIVLCKNKKTVGIGAGQMSRLDASQIALMKTNILDKKKGFVAASDAFFPFTDNIKLLIKNNCKAIVQPSGSINDKKIIDYANQKQIPLYFSKNRFFKH